MDEQTARAQDESTVGNSLEVMVRRAYGKKAKLLLFDDFNKHIFVELKKIGDRLGGGQVLVYDPSSKKAYDLFGLAGKNLILKEIGQQRCGSVHNYDDACGIFDAVQNGQTYHDEKRVGRMVTLPDYLGFCKQSKQ